MRRLAAALESGSKLPHSTNQSMPSGRTILVSVGTAFLLATLVAGVWVARHSDDWLARRPSPGPQKRYSTEIAEGVRLRDFRHFGIDLLSFKSCRIEKLRRGPVTLGAFNVLVLEEVVVHLVPSAGQDATFAPAGSKPVQDDSLEAFAHLFKGVQGLASKKFSNVRIKGLAVNRWADGATERLFTAASAEGGVGTGRHIRLDGCVVFEPDGAAKAVGAARLVLKPEIALVYTRDGSPCHLPLATK